MPSPSWVGWLAHPLAFISSRLFRYHPTMQSVQTRERGYANVFPTTIVFSDQVHSITLWCAASFSLVNRQRKEKSLLVSVLLGGPIRTPAKLQRSFVYTSFAVHLKLFHGIPLRRPKFQASPTSWLNRSPSFSFICPAAFGVPMLTTAVRRRSGTECGIAPHISPLPCSTWICAWLHWQDCAEPPFLFCLGRETPG